MYPATAEQMPTPLSSLDSLIELGDVSEKPMKVFIGHNLGYRTFMMHVPMHEFFEMSAVANDPGTDGAQIAQRKLDPVHAQKLSTYILKGLVAAVIHRREIEKKEVPQSYLAVQDRLGKQPYLSLQPLVVNVRECNPAGQNIRGMRLVTADQETASFKIFLSQRHVFWVVDGQHRRKAMESVFEFLDTVRNKRTYPKKGSLYPFLDIDVTPDEFALWEECFSVARSFCTVAVEVHLGLSVDQERQLFHDLNRLGKRVDTNLALNFDSSNAVNLFIKDRLIDQLGLKVEETEQKDWHSDAGALTRKEVVGINAILFLNKTNIGGTTPVMVAPKQEIAYQFWETVVSIPGFGEERAKEKTVAAQPVVLKALAKLVFDFAFSNRRGAEGDQHLELLLNNMTEVDFSHDNPMWRYFEFNDEQRRSHGLSELSAWLPEADPTVNRDLGGFQGGVMRFGAKHNDIYPLIGDMIRWKLNLPSRHNKPAIG
ncbi:DNA sulfur modification protein DndB [Cupriavidus sp. CV2]|uniref:DNA sulfur modification protein DndB n=1 Tax=Cupriavidus ulmosensis TaxID=3065913 RepID=UPI00296B0E57|nr:DNA sulfur modification protein DndB [Cupriavidus sp. CV2]MDW3681600.1 DNA sulfur modification protein DndB [Cupriavidus sp. CV2]